MVKIALIRMNTRQKNIAFFLLFLVLTLLFTYPLVLRIGSALRGTDLNALGDPLFNTWVLAWDDHKISRLDFKGFLDANTFYPQPHTLLYSEILLPQSLLALPVQLLTGNPVLAYNFVFLLSLILSGYGMFLLARHLTKSVAGGIAAGLIFAFSPFFISHFFQIQIVSAWGIPFAFLYLHKFFEQDRLKYLLLFTFFYVAQALSNDYYALYLSFFMGLWILYFAIAQKKYRQIRFWAQMGLFGLISLAMTGPIFYQYAKIHNEMGFVRGMDFYARLTSYLAAPPVNWLYGRITARFIIPEGELFPGIMAFVLATISIITLVKARERRISEKKDEPKKSFYVIRRVLNILILISAVIMIFIMGEGGLDLKILGFKLLRAHNLGRSLALFSVLLIVRILLDMIFKFERRTPKHPDERNLIVYAGMLLLAFLLTFGPHGPYLYLYKYVPGFQAVRVASRFGVMVMFALAALAAFGLRDLIRRFRPAKKTAWAGLILLIIGIEYLSVPIPYYTIPVKREIPDCYQWLAASPERGVLVELPLPSYAQGAGSVETARMYFSTYHWNSLINGYSGWFPPLYSELCRRWEKWPLEKLLRDFRTLGVKYVLIHFDEFAEQERPAFKEKFAAVESELRLVKQFEDDYLCEVMPKNVIPTERPTPVGLKKLDRTGWTVRASVSNDRAPLAIDGSLETRWDTGAQNPGDFFEIDLNNPSVCRCVSLKFGPSGLDFPRGYKMEISSDAKTWTEVARDEQTDLPILRYVKPRDLDLDIFMPPRETRYIRITNLGEDNKFYWSIYDIQIYQ
jgi:hypothetical protein